MNNSKLNTVAIIGLLMIIMSLIFKLNNINDDLQTFKTSYNLQVDSLNSVIKQYRINDPDVTFLIMYKKMEQSNKLIDRYLHILELTMRDIEEMSNATYKKVYGKTFEPWDCNISLQSLDSLLTDTSLITNHIRD